MDVKEEKALFKSMDPQRHSHLNSYPRSGSVVWKMEKYIEQHFSILIYEKRITNTPCISVSYQKYPHFEGVVGNYRNMTRCHALKMLIGIFHVWRVLEYKASHRAMLFCCALNL